MSHPNDALISSRLAARARALTLERVRKLRAGLGDCPEADLLRRIELRILRKDLDLPRFPDVAILLSKTMAAPNLTVNKIVEVVRQDPEVVHQVVAAASTSHFSKSPKTLDQAIVRMGLDRVWKVGVGQALARVAFLVPHQQEAVAALRDRGLLIGEVAERLSGEGRGPHYMAGLFEPVGEMLVHRDAPPNKRGRAPAAAFVRRLADDLRQLLSFLAVCEWGIGDECASAIWFHGDPSRAPEAFQRTAALLAVAERAVAVVADEARPCPRLPELLGSLGQQRLGVEGLIELTSEVRAELTGRMAA